jgi:hypothetical protein
VALKFTLHAGRALTVILKGTRRAPMTVLRHDFDLADPWVLESRHPYHQARGARRLDGEAASRLGGQAARNSTSRAVGDMVSDMKSHGVAPHHVALVVSSLTNPEQVAGAHTRAHAKEEALYRRALGEALESYNVAVTTFAGDELRMAARGDCPMQR